MEHIRGPNLQDYVRDHPLAPRPAAELVARLARALALPHARQIIHQDLKPSNVLMDENGQPRIIDFGLARLRPGPEEEGGARVSGTPAYMAPEQARGQVSPASDVFALGAILYFLLVGRAPFAARTVRDSLALAEKCDFDRDALRRRGIPRPLAAICLRAMDPDPARRPPTAERLARDLERYLRRRKLVALWGVVLLLLSGVAFGAWRLGHGTSAPAAETPEQPQLLVSRVQRSIRGTQEVLDTKAALPLRNGDRVRIGCDLPHGLNAALYLLDTEGRLTRLEPTRLAPGQQRDQLLYPAEGVVPIEGSPGTELFVVVAVKGATVPTQAIERAFANLGPLPPLPPQTSVLFTRERTEVQGTRGVGAPESDPLSSVQDSLDRLRQRLAESVEFVAGAALAHE
jgi:hypothetical protein